jgi:hypothetical protein
MWLEWGATAVYCEKVNETLGFTKRVEGMIGWANSSHCKRTLSM